MFSDQTTDLLIKNIIMRLIGSCNNLALKRFFSVKKTCCSSSRRVQGGIFFLFLSDSWSLQKTDATQVPFIAPPRFSSTQTVPTRQPHWTIKTSIQLPVCCHPSVKSWFFHQLPSYRCIWLIGPVSEISDHPLSSASLISVLIEQVPWSGCTVSLPHPPVRQFLPCESTFLFCFVLFYPDWIHQP